MIVVFSFLTISFVFCGLWFDTFRKRDFFEVENILGITQYNVSVEVEFFTSDLNSTVFCNDIAFTNENNELLPFYIEKCGEWKGTAWVLVEDIQDSNPFTLYMYYYDYSVTKNTYEIEMSSQFAFLWNFGSTCPEGSVVWDQMDGHFAVGSDKQYFNSYLYDIANHSHSFSPYSNVTSGSVDDIYMKCSFEATFVNTVDLPTYSHRHNVSFENGNILFDNFNPEYLSFLYCHQNRTDYNPTTKNFGTRFPSNSSNLIFLFDDPNHLTLSSVKWDLVPDSDGKYIFGTISNPGTIGGSPTHSHKLPKLLENIPFDVDDYDTASYNYYKYRFLLPEHWHVPRTSTWVTNEVTNEPPYLYLTMRMSLEDQLLPPKAITLLHCNETKDGNGCDIPIGWNLYQDLNNKFPRICESLDGCVVGEPGGAETHTHNFTGVIHGYDPALDDPLSRPFAGYGGATDVLGVCINPDHEHNFNGTVFASDSIPKHHKLIYIQRKNSSEYSRVTKKRTDFMKCFEYEYFDVSHVCSDHGDCNEFNNCTCTDSKYYGPQCNDTFCFGIDSLDRNLVCSGGHGVCWDYDTCACYPNYYGAYCNISTCFGYFQNATDNRTKEEICSGHGTCIGYQTCVCVEDWFDKRCNESVCFGYLYNDTRTCGGHGTCVDYNVCDCWDENYYYGKECNITFCFDVPSNESRTCNEHGTCVEYDVCECWSETYNYTEKCGWTCNKYLHNSRYTCSGHGDCYDAENCTCVSSKYSGKYCNVFSCFGIENGDVSRVCSGHGSCVDVDNCVCQVGYSTTNASRCCDTWFCGKFEMNSLEACTGMGVCTSHQNCDCTGGYEGEDCETWSCGYLHTDSNTCNGNGVCSSPDNCECETGFSGDKCETNDLLAEVMAPILAVGTVGAMSLFVIVVIVVICCACLLFVGLIVVFIVVFCVAVCSLCLLIVFLVCGTLCLGCVALVYRFRVQKFSKLKNFDILMKEQEMEEDSSIAHLSVNRGLFVVDYDEIKIDKILGEGGSQSTVYLAKWKGSKVAFKCFKTRTLCQDQNSFDEFEREVKIMSSVNHPNVIQFLGATLNPPRVGILMEFCENGEIIHYYMKHRDSHPQKHRYPLFEKFRMMLEISGAFDYLHSRSIIHRDLKSENVLLNGKENCKLMDFGLSRLVDRMSQAKTTRIGTAFYMAPEIINDANYDERCDVFSFAILMYIQITEDENPYTGEGGYGIEIKVSSNPDFRPKRETFEKGMNEHFEQEEMAKVYGEEVLKDLKNWLWGLITTCWKHKADERFGFKEISEKLMSKGDELQKIKDGGEMKWRGGTDALDVFDTKKPDVESNKTENEDSEMKVDEESKNNGIVIAEKEEEGLGIKNEEIKSLQEKVILLTQRIKEMEEENEKLKKKYEKEEEDMEGKEEEEIEQKPEVNFLLSEIESRRNIKEEEEEESVPSNTLLAEIETRRNKEETED